MCPTLFHIPHQLGPLPVFGWGWALIGWIMIVLVWGGSVWRQVARRREFLEQLPFLLLVAAAIVWMMPALEQTDSSGARLGLPVRGYGVFLLLGLLAAIGLAALRAQQVHLPTEVIYTLAVWLVVGGILGARVFYVIQYWQEFRHPSWWQTMIAIVKFTEGGLVVYGAIIGGLAASLVYVRRRGLPVLGMADLIAPSLAIGYAFGRIGCLMTGCCYGGLCHTTLPCLQFPTGSPAYDRQLQEGTIWGMELEPVDDRGWRLKRVLAGSPAEQRGLQAGEVIRAYRSVPLPALVEQLRQGQLTRQAAIVELQDGREIVWTVAELPSKSQPVHPAQIYDSINGFLLAALTWILYSVRCRDGVVFATLFTLYPVSRFLMEIIRSDERGQFGTNLTISQWLCLVTLVLVGLLWLRIARGPRRLSFAAQHEQRTRQSH